MSRFSEMSIVDQVHSLYSIYYGRPADPSGLNFWVQQITQKGSDGAIRAFGDSAESRALFAGFSTEARVDLVYQTLFSRDADAQGRTFYADLIDRKIITLSELSVVVLNGVQPGSNDEPALLGRITAAKKFTAALDNPTEVKAYSGSAAVTAGRDYLSSVLNQADGQKADADFAIAKLVAGPAKAGSSFALTVDADAFTTTNGNDVITGDLGTFQSTDIIQDSSAFDNDVLNVTANTLDGGSPQIVGIEKINLTWTGTGSINFSAAKIKGNQSFATMTPTEISLSATAIGFIGNATVFDLGSNNLVSGNGITRAITVTGVDKSNVSTGSAIMLDAGGNPGSSLDIIVGTALNTVKVGGFTEGVTLNLSANKSLALNENNGIVSSYAVRGTGALDLSADLVALNGDTLSKFNSGGVFVTLSGSGSADLSKVEADQLTFSNSLLSTINLSKLSTINLSKLSNVVLNGANNSVSFAAPVVASTASNSNALEVKLTQAMAGSITATDYATVTLNAAAATALPLANGGPKGPDLILSNANFSNAAVALKGGNDVTLQSAVMKSLDASALAGSLTANIAASSIKGSQGVNNLTITPVQSERALGLDISTNDAADIINLGSLGGALRTTTVSTAAGNDTVYANLNAFQDGDSLTVDLGDGSDRLEISALRAPTGSLIFRGGDGEGDDVLALVNGSDLSNLTVFSTSLQEIRVLDHSALDVPPPTTAQTSFATVQAELISGVSFKVTAQAAAGRAGAFTTDDMLIVQGTGRSETIDLSKLIVTAGKADSVLLTVNAGAGDDIIIGSQINDVINGGLGKDVMTGGLGADIFVIGNDDSGITLATADVITDFVSGTDKLKLGVAATRTNYKEVAPSQVVAPGFDAALIAANVEFKASTALEYVFVSSGGNGYLFIDNGANGVEAEQVVVLQGLVDNNKFALADIIA